MMSFRDNKIIVTGEYDGLLPVRVLQDNVLKFFTNGNSRVVQDWECLVSSRRINREIERDCRRQRVYTPSINFVTGKIYIQETFEAALWAASFGLLVLHDAVATKYGQGEPLERLDNSDPLIKDAFGLLAYMENLFEGYQAWPQYLPNPEEYSLERKDIVEKANNIYVTAAAFSLAHEFGHVFLGHGDKDYWPLLTKAHSAPSTLTMDEQAILKELENAADQFAMEHFLSELPSDSEKTVRLFGMLVVYACLLIGKKHRTLAESPTHPDLITRINRVLSYNIEDVGFQDSLRGAVLLALIYFFQCQDISVADMVFDDAEKAFEYCCGLIDTLKDSRN